VTLLVVGASGYLGGEICRQAVAAGSRVVGTYLRAPGTVAGVTWVPLDVRDGAAVRAVVARSRPGAVVNTAYAYGDWAVTATGAASVALAAVAVGARLVHLSSDAVHAGRELSDLDDEPPVAVDDLAAAVMELALGYPAAPAGGAGSLGGVSALDVVGLLNVAGPEAVSRVALGRLVAAHYGLDGSGSARARSPRPAWSARSGWSSTCPGRTRCSGPPSAR
jgi:dTDP-4-dehydrorhamnose reductase